MQIEGSAPTFELNQRYRPEDVPGLTQYDPGIWTDPYGHFFKADPTTLGTGFYVGTSPTGTVPVQGGTPSPSPPMPPAAPVPPSVPGTPPYNPYDVPRDPNPLNQPTTPVANTNTFQDPASRQMEQVITDQLKRLLTPYQPSSLDPAIQAITNLANRSSQQDVPAGLSAAIDAMTKYYQQATQAAQGPSTLPGTLDQMQQYIQQLRGPAYTPQQLDVMQTQALDPLERQRAQARQQVVSRLAAQGISPSSGIAEKALQEVDNQYNTIRAQTQGAFANAAIQQGITNQQQAAQYAMLLPQLQSTLAQQALTGLQPAATAMSQIPAMQSTYGQQQLGNLGTAANALTQASALQQQQYQNQLNQGAQAVNLSQIVPTTAWNRLIGANQTIQDVNPASLLQLLNQFQTMGYNQSNDFTAALMQILQQLFGQG